MRCLIALGASLALVMTGCGGDDTTGGGDAVPPDVVITPEVVDDAEVGETEPDVAETGTDGDVGDISADVGPAPDGAADDTSDATSEEVTDAEVATDGVPSGTGAPCLEHSDCAVELFCIEYECHSLEDGVGQPCGSDADCVEGLACVDNQCGDKPIVCGDGFLDEGEECDDGAANSDTLPNTCRENCLSPFCGDAVADSGEDCDDANQDETDGCSSLCIGNAAYDKPVAGDLVITELMINPAAASDPFGEWIEIYNQTDEVLSLVGCEIHDQGTDVIPLGEQGGFEVIESGQHLVLGFSADLAKNGGVAVDVTYSTMLLDNVTDEVVISCPDGVVDEVAYGVVLFPIESGASMSLDGVSVDVESNDLPFSWCPASATFGAGDYGSPGAPNPPCPEADVTLDHCELVGPAAVTHIIDVPADLTVHVTEAGLTDQTPGVDTTAALWVQVGYGATGSDPVEGGWTWTVALPVEEWNDEAGVDAHHGSVGPPEIGTTDVAARVSLDAGETWAYCDLAPGSSDGYQPQSAVELSTIEDPCLSALCDAPPSSTCADDGITSELYDPLDAICSVADWSAVCSYPPQLADCGQQGLICEGAGECVAGAALAPVEGEVILNELLLQPTKVSAGVGVWLELHNPGDAILDLTGCTVGYEGGATVTLDTPMLIAAGGFRVLAPTASESGNGGVPADYGYGNALTLMLAPSTLQIHCGGALIDQVAYSPLDWPVTAGASLSLSPYHGNAEENDSVSSWCLGQTPYGDGDLGTPGAPNIPCAGDEEPVDDCRIEGPASVEALAGAALSVAGFVVEGGVTDATPQTDVTEATMVEAGWGPVGDAPDEPTWLWTSAGPDLDWDASVEGGLLLEDRWQASLDAPPPGTYALLVRASVDGGHTWSPCDLDGAANGLDLDQAVSLVTTPSPCDPSPCVVPPEPACDGTLVVDWQAPVYCSVVDDDSTQCAWTPLPVQDCGDEGAECEEGVCVNYPQVPGPGELVVSEVLIVPEGGESGEWIELTLVGDEQVTLTGCSLESGAGQTWAFVADTPLEALVAPGGVIVAARSTDVGGEVNPDFVYGEALSLGNSGDEIRLICDGQEVDAVAWDQSAGWLVPVHGTLSLSGNRLDGADNDLLTSWCEGPGDEDEDATGTPGSLNPLCPSLDGVIEACVLEGPLSVEVDHGASAELAVRLFDEGTTDADPGVDAAPGMGAEVGYGPSGTVPDADWTWFSAAPDAEWEDSAAPGEDRWVGSVIGTQSGTWDVAARVTADDGESWLICDSDGSADGYDPTASGTLIVGPSACDPNPCTAPPESSCEGDSLQIPLSPGLCTADEEGVASCEYDEVSFDCSSYDGCDAGVCLAPPATPWSPGDLVVTEVHRDSLLGVPDTGEWIEIYNPSSSDWDLRTCTLTDLGGDSWTVTDPAPVVLEQGAYMVLAADADLGIGVSGIADLVWSGVGLDNLFDEVILTCGGTEIDAVAWSPDWPGDEGTAMQLSTTKTTASGNDAADAWCAAETPIGDSGETGTPGEANVSCP